MRHLPVFLDIAGRACLVVGGGEIAARKIALLRRAGGRVRVASPELVPSLSRDLAAGRFEHIPAEFTPDQMDGAAVVVAATDDRSVNARVSWIARQRGIPVNVVDDPALCTFQVPAIIDRDPVLIAVSTGGASPVLARWIRRRIEQALPSSLGRLGDLAQRWRARIARRYPSTAARKRFWESLFDGPAAALALAGREPEADAAVERMLGAPQARPGDVHLVGAGPGDPELLTLKAHRLLQSADVIVYDRLVSDGILDLARRDAEMIYVGKAPGIHAMKQGAINALLIDLARQGKQVVRLKGGDPFVFGRGGEEMLAVEGAGLPCHIVPGISAAGGIGAATGVPLTHRGLARNVTYITGHTSDGEPDADWDALSRPGQTVAVYMGLAALPRITQQLLAHGRDRDVPAIVVEERNNAGPARLQGHVGRYRRYRSR